MATGRTAEEHRPSAGILVKLALDWLARDYGAQRFFVERDVEAALQRRLDELIQESQVPLRVFNSFPIEPAPRRALCADLALVAPDGSADLVIELKYEPSHMRKGKDIWHTKFP